MKPSAVLLLLLCAFGLSSCIETLEEVFFNKDGSGVYSTTVDMSEFFNNPMMKGMLEEAMKEDSSAAPFDMTETDTLINMGQDAPEGSLLKRANMHLKMSDAEGEFKIKITFPFEKVDEIADFFEELNESGESMSGLPGGDMLTSGGRFEWSKRKLVRQAKPKGDEASPLEGEDGDFMKMFLADASHKTVYHFPGKVKSTDIQGATIDGKTLSVEHSLIDLMEGEADLAGSVKFKRR